MKLLAHIAVIRMGFRRFGVQCHHPREEVIRLLHVAPLCSDHGEEVKGRELPGIASQDRLTQLRGRGEIAPCRAYACWTMPAMLASAAF